MPFIDVFDSDCNVYMMNYENMDWAFYMFYASLTSLPKVKYRAERVTDAQQTLTDGFCVYENNSPAEYHGEEV